MSDQNGLVKMPVSADMARLPVAAILNEAAWTVADESARKDRRIAELEASVTCLIGVCRGLVSLAKPISLPTFRLVQAAILQAQRARDAA